MIDVTKIPTEALSRRLQERETERDIHLQRLADLDAEIFAIKVESLRRE